MHYQVSGDEDSSSDNSSGNSDNEEETQQTMQNSIKEDVVKHLYVEIRRQWMELNAQSGKKLSTTTISRSSKNNNYMKRLDSIIGMPSNLLSPQIPDYKVLPLKRTSRAGFTLTRDPSIKCGVFAAVNMSENRYIMEVIGEASKRIKKDTSILGTPPAQIFYYPKLDLCLDTRSYGNDARYIRRSCCPNSELKSIILKNNASDQMVHLGVYTKEPVDRTEEITIGWNWTKGHIMWKKNREFEDEDSSPKGMDAAEKKRVKEALDRIKAQFEECACEDDEGCLFVYLENELEREEEEEDTVASSPSSGSSTAIGIKRKRPTASSSSRPRKSTSASRASPKTVITDEEKEEEEPVKKSRSTTTATKKLARDKGKGKATSIPSSPAISVDIDITSMSPAPSRPTSDIEYEMIGSKRRKRRLSIAGQSAPKKRWLKQFKEDEKVKKRKEAEEKARLVVELKAAAEEEKARASSIIPDLLPEPSPQPMKSPEEIAQELEQTVYDDGDLSDGGSSQSTLPLDNTLLAVRQDTVAVMESCTKLEVEEKEQVLNNNDTKAVEKEELEDENLQVPNSSNKEDDSKAAEKKEEATNVASSETNQQANHSSNLPELAVEPTMVAEPTPQPTPQPPKVKLSLKEYLQRQNNLRASDEKQQQTQKS